MISERIPFEEAIGEPLLFKNRFDSLSFGQRVALKIINGLPLSEKIVSPETGWTELDIWAAFQGFGEFDELGYLTKPGKAVYNPKDYREFWGVIGRRGSKTDSIGGTQVAYEAVCGGHESFFRKGQRGIAFLIAQDLRMARYSLHFIRAALESSPIGRKMMGEPTADRIDLNNMTTIATVPPSLKAVRGYAAFVVVMDEVGSWYMEAEAANPDYEIYRAVTPGQTQFPYRKLLGISTPWSKGGLLYRFAQAGTEGRNIGSSLAREEFADVLVLQGPTAMMENPLITRGFLAKERNRDPKAFEREFLAQFQDSVSNFIPVELVEAAVDRGTFERKPEPRPIYVAALDPAFRRDAFGFLILHKGDDGQIVTDLVRRWVAVGKNPLNPSAILDEIAELCKQYGISYVFSDQYHLESLQELSYQRGIPIIGTTFTAKNKAQLFGNLQQLFHQKRIRLIDNPELVKELKNLERTLTSQGQVHISAPQGQHDDVATTLALAAGQAMFLDPDLPAEKEPTPFERHLEQIANRHRMAGLSAWD